MKVFPNQRKEQQKSVQDLFKSKNLKKISKKEQRKEELAKLQEVQAQDKTYYYTLAACAGMIIILLCAAVFGGYK